VSACFACPCGAFLPTIIIPTLTLSFDHHRIPILVNPIDNGLEAFDHLIVVPGLARLCQNIGVTSRLSTLTLSLRTRQTIATWNSIPCLPFEAIIPKRTADVFNLFYCLCFYLCHPHHTPPLHCRFRLTGVFSTLVFIKTLFLSAHILQPRIFSPVPCGLPREQAPTNFSLPSRWTSRLEDCHALYSFCLLISSNL
jgi:hypothetical protein